MKREKVDMGAIFKFNILISLLLILALLMPVAFAQEGSVATISSVPVSSYELFWPITAGQVMGDSFYFLKSFKENFREIFIFSDVKKAEYNMTLSEKRTVEAEKLFLTKKDFGNGRLSLDASQVKREKALEFFIKAKKAGRDVGYLKSRLNSSFERQKTLLAYLTSQVPEDQRLPLQEGISKLNSLLKALQ